MESGFAQDFDDAELIEEAEEMPPPQQPTEEVGEEGDGIGPAPAPGRFRPNSRFGNPNSANGGAGRFNSPSATGAAPGSLMNTNVPTLPTKAVRGKIPFRKVRRKCLARANVHR